MKNNDLKGKKKNILKIILIIIAIVLLLSLVFLIYVKAAFLSKDEVKEIVLEKMNANEDDVYFESIDLELDKNEYEVEVYYNNNDYEFKISAKEGKVIYADYYVPNNNIDSNNSTNYDNNTTSTQSNNISLDDALNIVLKDANVTKSDVTIIKKYQDYDDNELVYDIEFHYSGYEYDYEVRAKDGMIIDFNKEQLRRNGVN